MKEFHTCNIYIIYQISNKWDTLTCLVEALGLYAIICNSSVLCWTLSSLLLTLAVMMYKMLEYSVANSVVDVENLQSLSTVVLTSRD